jgi:hypothetical protein
MTAVDYVDQLTPCASFIEDLNEREDSLRSVASKPTGLKEVSSLMDLNTFIIAVFCFIDDRIAEPGPLRVRGPAPRLCDSEVITIEVVGDFLGLDEDTELFAYFRRHYAHFFPNLLRVHRTTFTRQAANLWKAKENLWQEQEE